MKRQLSEVGNAISTATGNPFAMAGAFIFVWLWALTGPVFDFSETWQLIINTTTTIITFLMVFAIQHAQNRETAAILLKLDVLIGAIDAADDKLVGIEDDAEDAVEAARAAEREKVGK